MAKKTTAKRSWAKLPERSSRWKAQREALLEAAQRAIQRAGPQASMDEIAAEAGVTKPILYRHFGDRRGLARALRGVAFGFVLGAENEGSAEIQRAARARVAALYPVVDDSDALRRVVAGFGSGLQMFVEYNRNVYRFLRQQGVLEDMWAENDPGAVEPIAESLSSSLQAIFGKRGVDPTTALIWAHGLRGMVGGIVDWWTEFHACNRFEVERQFDLLTRALLTGLDHHLPPEAKKKSAGAARRGRAAAASAARGTRSRSRPRR